MEKGGRNDDNYDNVNMDMSDESDNDMFACKEEYKAFKQQFSDKPKKADQLNEYGGDMNEYGGGGGEYGGGSATATRLEYGGMSTGNQGHADVTHTQNRNLNDNGQKWHGRPQFDQRRRSPSPTPAKIEREPKLYKDNPPEDDKTASKSRRDKSRERRSKSRDRSKRTRSRSKGRRRSQSRDRGKDRRRSRSRSRDRGRDRKGDHHGSHDSRDRRDWRRDGRRDGRDDGRDRRGSNFRRERDEHRRNIEEQMKKVEEMGVEMPKYYKAGAINPMSYAEQVQKRKMLWKKPGSGEEEEKPAAKVESVPKPGSATSFNKWEATNFGDDKANEKFRRLMGIKSAPKPEEMKVEDAPGKDSERIMSDLQKNYDQARQQTHRNRGIGLGFSNAEGGHMPQQHLYPGQQGFAVGHGYGAQPQGPASAGRGSYGINFVKKQ